jgi:hypothetical protein
MECRNRNWKEPLESFTVNNGFLMKVGGIYDSGCLTSSKEVFETTLLYVLIFARSHASTRYRLQIPNQATAYSPCSTSIVTREPRKREVNQEQPFKEL